MLNATVRCRPAKLCSHRSISLPEIGLVKVSSALILKLQTKKKKVYEKKGTQIA